MRNGAPSLLYPVQREPSTTLTRGVFPESTQRRKRGRPFSIRRLPGLAAEALSAAASHLPRSRTPVPSNTIWLLKGVALSRAMDSRSVDERFREYFFDLLSLNFIVSPALTIAHQIHPDKKKSSGMPHKNLFIGYKRLKIQISD
ncbi:MAG: hypothetical protein JW807_15610 [Spirochaetes bacterium]|nr:hypothetical protein [Spirochaetota bacterium]